MAVQKVLKMGNSLLYQRAEEVRTFHTPDLDALIRDMFDTMVALNGAGLAAPQIGVSQRVVIFEVQSNPRYPEAEAVPRTILINPVLEPIGEEMDDGWEGCLSVPGLRGLVSRYKKAALYGFRRGRTAYRPHGVRLPCPRGAARMRPPRRRPLSHAPQGYPPTRFRGGAVPDL